MQNEYREFLKDSVRKRIDFSWTAQSRGEAPPPRQKPCPPGAKKIALTAVEEWNDIPAIKLETAIARRKSRRSYTNGIMTTREKIGDAQFDFIITYC